MAFRPGLGDKSQGKIKGVGPVTKFGGIDIVEKGKMDQEKARSILSSVASALRYIYERGACEEVPFSKKDILEAIEAADSRNIYVRENLNTIVSYSDDEEYKEVQNAAREALDVPVTSLVDLLEFGLAREFVLERAKELLEEGADLYETGTMDRTPLMLAVYDRDMEMAELILDSIPEDQLMQQLEMQDLDGENVLMLAVRSGKIELVELILDKIPEDRQKAYINSESRFGNTALRIACTESHVDIAELLISREADYNHKKKGTTILFETLNLCGESPIVKLLRAKGAAFL